MDKNNKINSRKQRAIAKRKKQRFIVLLVIIFFLVSGTTFKVFSNFKSSVMASAINREVVENIVFKNPISLNLKDKVEKIAEEEAKHQVEIIREMEEKKKLEEEKKRLEEEKKANKDKKIAYLTFDDGPSAYVTPRILDILNEHDVKATFFILGKMVDANPEVLKRVHNEGHAIAHHTYSHDYNHVYKNVSNFIGELNKTNDSLKRVLGKDFETKILRFPGGSFEKSKQKFIKETEKLGYKNYDWDALNGDAEGHGLSKQTLVNRLKSTVASRKGQGEVIILMHDTDAKKTTADALPEIIDYLKKEGYEFGTLDQK